jgi:hypothetical protein
MAKTVISRNFRYPSAELRDKVRVAVKERGFRRKTAARIRKDARAQNDTIRTLYSERN